MTKRRELVVLRAKYGMSQTDVATILDTSVSNYCLIEQGKREGSLDFWIKLQNYFKISDGEIWQMYINRH